METIKLYVLEQHDEIKGFVVATSITEAMKIFQAQADADTVDEDYFRDLVIVPNEGGRADWEIEVRENYKGTSEERGMSTALIAELYQLYELDFVIGRVFGTI